MKHFMIGTAGHIDHGKTSLIRALTGRNTDRLEEETRRGITIDLGFTYYDDPNTGIRVGIIDVPGHEKFVTNMLSGVHGMDMEEAARKPVLGEMIRRKMFERYIVLGNDGHPGKVKEIYDERGSVLCRK